MMPARMVSRVASATRKRAASTGREATRVEVPETFWMMMFPGMSSISPVSYTHLITVPSVLTTLVSDELDFPNLSMVGVDDRAAARTAVSHLIAQGHRKIAVLGGPTTSYPSRMRRLGAQDAMEDAGLVFDDRLYGLSNYDFESAYHAMNSLLARCV